MDAPDNIEVLQSIVEQATLQENRLAAEYPQVQLIMQQLSDIASRCLGAGLPTSAFIVLEAHEVVVEMLLHLQKQQAGIAASYAEFQNRLDQVTTPGPEEH